MKDDTFSRVTSSVPLRVFFACGLAGMAVDAFDGLALLGAPEWFHKLDVLAAVGYTVALCGLGAYTHIRHNRTRRTAEDS
jgi:hypothetical protein